MNLLKAVASSNLCDDLQVFDERPLCGQQFFGDEIGLICGKLLDTVQTLDHPFTWKQSLKMWYHQHRKESMSQCASQSQCLNDDQTLWITFDNIYILFYSTWLADKWFQGLQTGNKAPSPVCIPTFLLASSSSSLRTHPASVSSGLVRGDSCRPSGFWIRTTSLSVPVPPMEPLPLTTTWWGLSAGDSSDPGFSGEEMW